MCSKVSVAGLIPSILDAFDLDGWAVTHSLRDGCFWAHLPIVWGQRPSYTYPAFWDLNLSLSCFSFGTQAYPAPLTPVFYDGDEFGVLQDAEGFLPLNTQLVLYLAPYLQPGWP